MAAAMKSPPHWHHGNSTRADIQRALAVRSVPNPLVVTWRWRYETLLALGLAGGLATAMIAFGALPTALAVLVLTCTILFWPTARQFTVDRAWCIITPHRVRAGCIEGLVYSRRGKIPIILWTSHQAFGERVLLWCRAGTSVDDFVSAHAVLTAACWAQDVAIFSDVHHPHLVSLDIIRRPSDEVIDDVEGRRSTDPAAGPPTWPYDQET
jgi:hypothetical protein